MAVITTNLPMYSGLILMVLYVLFFKVKNGRVKIDHVVLLFIGFSYYVYMPLYSFNKGIFINDYQADAFLKLNISDINEFLLIFLGLIVTVIISDLRSKDIRLNPTKFGTSNVKLMKVILIVLVTPELFAAPAPSELASVTIQVMVRLLDVSVGSTLVE